MRKELKFAVWVWVFLVVYSKDARVGATTDPNDIKALMQLKADIDAATIDATSCLGTWDFSVDPCESRFREQFSCGIDCTDYDNASVSENLAGGRYQRVTGLQLDNSGYAGSLSPWLGNLTELRFLRISGNSLTGGIPDTIGKLYQLIMLDLSFNNFNRYIPDGVTKLTNLQSLNIGHNKLQGVVPPFLKKLSYLTELRLESNQLRGPFPDLRALGLLQMLDVSDNALSGTFPRGLPPSICSICFRNNKLGGKLPKAIASLHQLNVLDLSNNAFTGCVSDAMLSHPSLQQLNLSMNQLSELKAHEKHVVQSPLVALDLSYNLMSGPLPSFFAFMRELSSLSLRYNFFHGVIPQSYGIKVVASVVDMKPLKRLMLDGNYLTGPLPVPFMHLDPEHGMAASFADNCFQSCPREFTFCQGNQKTWTLCRLFNSLP